MRHIFLLVLSSLIIIPQATSQTISEDSKVSVSGSGAVELEPNYATISVGVTAQAKTAQEAASTMSDGIDAVVDTLVALGISRNELPTNRFDISPVRDRADYQKIVGYSASVSLELRIEELDQIARHLSAVVDAGATDVGNVVFRSTEMEAARHEAVRLAVASATSEARVVAEASGARLGALIDISTGGAIVPRIASSESMMMRSDISSSAISPKDIVVTATISASWTLLPAN
jgi:uncharacterized protein YggE